GGGGAGGGREDTRPLIAAHARRERLAVARRGIARQKLGVGCVADLGSEVLNHTRQRRPGTHGLFLPDHGYQSTPCSQNLWVTGVWSVSFLPSNQTPVTHRF